MGYLSYLHSILSYLSIYLSIYLSYRILISKNFRWVSPPYLTKKATKIPTTAGDGDGEGGCEGKSGATSPPRPRTYLAPRYRPQHFCCLV
jgi:hypothetical protein